MRQITRELRGAYIQLLSSLQYKGVPVPVKSAMISGKGAVITVGNVEFEAYVNIINQFRGKNLIKNGLNHTTTLTLDINTVFYGDSYNAAGAEWVEELTDNLYDLLYDDEIFKLKEFGINNDRFIVTSTMNYSQPMPVQYTDTSRVFRSVLIFEHGIHHVKVDTPVSNLWIQTI